MLFVSRQNCKNEVIPRQNERRPAGLPFASFSPFPGQGFAAVQMDLPLHEHSGSRQTKGGEAHPESSSIGEDARQELHAVLPCSETNSGDGSVMHERWRQGCIFFVRWVIHKDHKDGGREIYKSLCYRMRGSPLSCPWEYHGCLEKGTSKDSCNFLVGVYGVDANYDIIQDLFRMLLPTYAGPQQDLVLGFSRFGQLSSHAQHVHGAGGCKGGTQEHCEAHCSRASLADGMEEREQKCGVIFIGNSSWLKQWKKQGPFYETK
ncbi:hypothetical protein S40288_11306 [Stachybotrys chartarum IBT 40288]|nr:hypothetical protein S40288_11306 [Stachybotrys chartarum IBT 40288]